MVWFAVKNQAAQYVAQLGGGSRRMACSKWRLFFSELQTGFLRQVTTAKQEHKR